jgi:hypothetical protein
MDRPGAHYTLYKVEVLAYVTFAGFSGQGAFGSTLKHYITAAGICVIIVMVIVRRSLSAASSLLRFDQNLVFT